VVIYGIEDLSRQGAFPLSIIEILSCPADARPCTRASTQLKTFDRLEDGRPDLEVDYMDEAYDDLTYLERFVQATCRIITEIMELTTVVSDARLHFLGIAEES